MLFRSMANSFQSEVRSVIDEPMEELRGTADMLRDATDFSGGTKKAAPTKPAAANPRPSPGPARSAPAVSAPSTDPDDRPDDGPDDVLGSALDDEDGIEAAPEDLVTRTLSGDVAPHDPTDEAGPKT